MSFEKILPINGEKENLHLLSPRAARSFRAIIVLVTVMISSVASALPAHAINNPTMTYVFPPDGGSARTPDALELRATYDRGLALPPSTFALRDRFGTRIDGGTVLLEPKDASGMNRTIAFRPSLPLDEAASPFDAVVTACPYLPGDCAINTLRFAIDNTPPAAPVVESPLAGSVAREQPVAIRGTAEIGATIRVFENDHEIAQDRATSAGRYAVVLPYPAEDGVAHSVTVFARDEAGNGSQPRALSFFHDSIVITPVITAPLTGSAFNVNAITVAGTAKPNTTIDILEGAASVGSAAANDAGRWSTTVTFGVGTHTITATSFDGHTTDGPSSPVTFEIDVTAPNIPVILTPGEAQHVNTRNVTVSGTAEPGATIQVREASSLRASATTSSGGAWSSVVTFTEGAHSITASATDAAGNISGSAARAFVVDTLTPSAPRISSPAQGVSINTSIVNITGTSEGSAVVQIREGGVPVGSTIASGSGAWSVAISFTDGRHTIAATATDQAGNVSAESTAISFIVDTVAPAIPIIDAPQPGSNLQSTSVLVAGTAEAGVRVLIYEGATLRGSTFAEERGLFSMTLTFPNGSHAVQARATDAAGNSSAISAPVPFSVGQSSDSTPPAAPEILTPAADSIQPQRVIFSGSAEQGANAKVFEVTGTGEREVAASDAPDGSWSTGGSFSSPGVHTVVAYAIDQAGNVSPPSETVTFTVDTQGPTLTIDQANPAVQLPLDQGAITGTATDDLGVARIDIEIDNKVTNQAVYRGSAQVCNGCPGLAITWEATAPLPLGVFRFRAYAVDRAGNRSAPVEITLIRVA